MTIPQVRLFIAVSLSLCACKREENEDPPPATGTGTVAIAFTFMNGAAPYSINTTVQDGAGHDVRFTTIKFYASDFHLEDDAGTTVAEFHDDVLLVDAAASSNTFTLGTMSAGHVHEAHLSLGLNSTLNAGDPGSAEYPLDQSDMHLGAGMGYQFLRFVGKVDGNGDGTFDDPEDLDVTYACGTDALLWEAHVHIHADVTDGATVTLAAKVDVAKFISGLDLLAIPGAVGGQPANVTAMDSLAVAIDEL